VGGAAATLITFWGSAVPKEVSVDNKSCPISVRLGRNIGMRGPTILKTKKNLGGGKEA